MYVNRLLIILLLLFSADSYPSTTSHRTLSNTSRKDLVSDFRDGKTAIIYAHQDDDLLWMQPFWKYANIFAVAAYPIPPAYDKVLAQYPRDIQARWRAVWGRTTDVEFASFWLNPCTRQDSIVLSDLKEKIRPIIASSKTRRIVTHNNWGEYGHIHHRLINQAVRELAVEYGKDVWALSNKVHLHPNPAGTGYDFPGDFGLATIYGDFKHKNFVKLRSAYQNQFLSVPINGRRFSTWTWGTGTYDYPTGRRTYIRLVNKGRDMTENNTGIADLVSRIPIYGTCPEQ